MRYLIFAARFCDFLRSIKRKLVFSEPSAREAVVIITFINILSKVVGYLRMILAAWLFGVSSETDAYNMVIGIVSIMHGPFTSGFENAVLPSVARLFGEDKLKARDLMGFFNLLVLLFALLVGGVMAICPDYMLRLFAPGFAGERLSFARGLMSLGAMLALISSLRPGVEAWAMGSGRYSLSSVAYGCGGMFSLATLMILGWAGFGVNAMIWSLLCANVVGLSILIIGLGDVPVGFRRVPWDAVMRSIRVLPPCLLMFGAGYIYIVVDRYFASLLPMGSITHVYYSEMIFSALVYVMSYPTVVYLVKASRSGPHCYGVDEVNRIAVAYGIPAGCLAFGLSIPSVGLMLGHGAFGGKDVITTGICVGILMLSLPFCLVNSVFYRLAQATGRLRPAALVTVLSFLLNGFLDWLLYRPIGVYGIVAATSSAVLFSTILYSKLFAGPLSSLGGGSRWLGIQLAFGAMWGGILMVLSIMVVGRSWFEIPLFVLGGIFTLGHFFVMDRLGVYREVASGWRPDEIAKLVFGRLSFLSFRN